MTTLEQDTAPTMTPAVAEAGLRLMGLVADRERTERDIADAVSAMRANGASWGAVRFALGRSRGAAQARSGRADLLRQAEAARR